MQFVNIHCIYKVFTRFISLLAFVLQQGSADILLTGQRHGNSFIVHFLKLQLCVLCFTESTHGLF